MICILCSQALDPKTKDEHILLNALGGRAKTKRVICSSCNGRFGHGPDQDLADSVGELRNQAQLYSGDGDPPPPIKGARTESGRYDYLADGSAVFVPDQAFSVNFDKEGVSSQINAASMEHADRLLTHAARRILKEFGREEYPESAIQTIKAELRKDGRRIISKLPSRRGKLELGGDSSQQSMAKAALVLWGKHLGAAVLQGPKYDTIRNFCRTGQKPEGWNGWVRMDARDLPACPPKFGTNPNIIWVGSNWLGQVYGYFRLYNILGWRFRLCEIGAPPNTSVCLVSNPFDPVIWDVRADRNSILTYDWVNSASAAHPEQSAARLEQMGRRGQDLQFKRFVERTVRSAFEQLGLTDGDEPNRDQIAEIIDFVGNRLGVLLTGVETEERLPDISIGRSRK